MVTLILQQNMLLEVGAPPPPTATSKAVYASDIRKEFELFIGYTTLSTTDPRALLADVYGQMSPSRLALYTQLATSEVLVIEARSIPGDDRWRHRHENNHHILKGKPYLRKLQRGGVLILKAGDTQEYILAGRPGDGAVPMVLPSGVETYVPLNVRERLTIITKADGEKELRYTTGTQITTI
jgi:hypothetical protein